MVKSNERREVSRGQQREVEESQRRPTRPLSPGTHPRRRTPNTTAHVSQKHIVKFIIADYNYRVIIWYRPSTERANPRIVRRKKYSMCMNEYGTMWRACQRIQKRNYLASKSKSSPQTKTKRETLKQVYPDLTLGDPRCDWLNTFSHPSPISDLKASIRALNASASANCFLPSSSSFPFVSECSNTDADARARRLADLEDIVAERL